MRYSPARIKFQIFPMRKKIKEEDCPRLITELLDIGVIEVYSVDGKDYLSVTNFKEHQKPNRPKASTLPPPPAKTCLGNDGEMFEQSTNSVQAVSRQGSNGSGNGNSSSKVYNVEKIEAVVEHLNKTCHKKYLASSKKTQSLINARLEEGHTVEQMKTVIDTKASHWLNDPKMKRFLRPSTLFSLTHFEDYLNDAEEGNRHVEYDKMRTL